MCCNCFRNGRRTGAHDEFNRRRSAVSGGLRRVSVGGRSRDSGRPGTRRARPPCEWTYRRPRPPAGTFCPSDVGRAGTGRGSGVAVPRPDWPTSRTPKSCRLTTATRPPSPRNNCRRNNEASPVGQPKNRSWRSFEPFRSPGKTGLRRVPTLVR